MKSLKDWLFPITLLAFIAPAVKYLNVVFTLNLRWGILFILAITMFFMRKQSRMNQLFLLFASLYTLWGLLTSIWSEAPALSFMKAAAFSLVLFVMALGGYSWALKKGIDKSMTYLMPIMFIAFFAALFGTIGDDAYSEFTAGVQLYQGLAGGPNMMGSLLCISMPYILWQIYRNWSDKRKRLFWLALYTASVVVLFFTASRSAILVALFTLAGLIFAFSTKKVIGLLYLLLLIGVCVYTIAPKLKEDVSQRVIYKHATEEQGVFYTREQVWEESFEQAKLGGLIGGGYGVTIGAPAWEMGNLSAVGYGREKGNSQLAIVEETGLIGLILYFLLLFVMLKQIFFAFRKELEVKNRVALGLALGSLGGMLVQSVFEAWWVAPGSPESVAFWAMAGVGLGLTRISLSGNQPGMQQRQRLASPLGLRPHTSRQYHRR